MGGCMGLCMGLYGGLYGQNLPYHGTNLKIRMVISKIATTKNYKGLDLLVPGQIWVKF
jgi:hypothetical protein